MSPMTIRRLDRLRPLARALAGIATLALAAPAGAAAVQFVDWNVPGASRGPIDVNAPVDQNVQAGEFRVLVDGSPFTTFCIELTQHIALPSPVYGSYAIVAPDSPLVAGGGFDALQLSRFGRLFEHYLDDSRASSTASAAFQVAVWEIAYDGSVALDLLGGGFRIGAIGASGTPGGLAGGWLSTLDQQAAGNWRFQVLHSDSQQDQLMGARVPLPASAWLLGAGLLALAGGTAGRRRRDRRG